MVETVFVVKDETLQRALRDPELIRGPVKDFLHKAGFAVLSRAQEAVPVDVGNLKASLKSKIEDLQAIVGSNVSYAANAEFGTPPHKVAWQELQPWAKRHGFGEGEAGGKRVARIIARHGTKPHPYLIPALEDSKPDIAVFLDDMGKDIEARWGQGGALAAGGGD